ncbi:Aste57867_8423 [Aphanomyces stellatus]|uniref:Aste57867_8423 protein n=1 Tax=Aphanomyces stellatus TaxID=120398 RepID=A0A485KK79_9STRA|nr:hypothetical protein As57867_008391 [Aphanomyces stellatus]VFT85309.1 Aste57867_8423 [Aphanomyces stellatus]
MKSFLRSFEAQRPSLPSAPHQYQPSLHLTKSEISAMFPTPQSQDILSPSDNMDQRRMSLVLHEKQRRRHSMYAPSAVTTDRKQSQTKELMPYEYYGEHLLAVQPKSHPHQRRQQIVLYAPEDEDTDSVDLRGRHSMPAKYCY